MLTVATVVLALLPTLPATSAVADVPPPYRVIVQVPSAPTYDFSAASGRPELVFRATALSPEADGSATVRAGPATRVKARFEHLRPAYAFGPGLETYVLWAVSPEGRAENLGELRPEDGEASITAEAPLSVFGLLVTAEPDFAVPAPGDAVVLEGLIADEWRARVPAVAADYKLVDRGAFVYEPGVTHAEGLYADEKVPLDVREAALARHRAIWDGAMAFAAEPLSRAEAALRRSVSEANAGDAAAAAAEARAAVQLAEDARLVALRAKEAERAEGQSRELLGMVERMQAKNGELLAMMDRAEAAEHAQREAETLRLASAAQRDELRDAVAQGITPLLKAQAAAPRPLVFTSVEVFFAPGSATLTPAAHETLSKLAGLAAGRPSLRLSVIGHADGAGTPAVNLRLSTRRAEAAREYLISQGVPEERVSAMGFGQVRPVADNGTATGRQRNRRVEVTASEEGGPVPTAGSSPAAAP